MSVKKMSVVLAGMACLVLMFAVVNEATLWSQEEAVEEAPEMTFAKDLQILRFESKAELGAYMKTMAESLGVTCKHCHDLTDFAVNDPDTHKETARAFMIMTKNINEGILKDSESKVTCFTCHQGRIHPVNSKLELQELLEAEEQ